MRKGFTLTIVAVVLLFTLLGCAPSFSKGSSPETPGTGFFLTVTQPADNSITSNERIEVKGRTSAGALVSVNEAIASADKQGNFAVTLTLEAGLNIIEVTASDEAGNEASVILTVALVKGG